MEVTEDERREDKRSSARIEEMIQRLGKRANVLHTEARKAEKESDDDRVIAIQRQLCEIVVEATHDVYSVDEVHQWMTRAMQMGGRFPRLRTNVIKSLVEIKKVPTKVLREGLLDYLENNPEKTYRDVLTNAYRFLRKAEKEHQTDYGASTWALGTDDKRNKYVVDILRQQLGLKVRTGSGGAYVDTFMPYERAVAITRAIGLEPITVGV